MTTFELEFLSQIAADLQGQAEITEEVITQAIITRCNRNTELAHEMRSNKHYKQALANHVWELHSNAATQEEE